MAKKDKKDDIEQTQMSVQNPEWDGETQEQAPFHRAVYQAEQTGVDKLAEADYETWKKD